MKIEKLDAAQIFKKWINQSEADARKDYQFLESLPSYSSTVVDQNAQAADKEAFQRINCQHCANCCKRLKPDLEESDITRISKFLGIDGKEFAKDFDQLTASNPCPFLAQNNLCQIYDIRPLACRDFPNTHKPDFTTRIIDHQNNLNDCPATFYVVSRMQALLNQEA